MMGTMNCVYETPCGWCSKWDKKCDRKINISKYQDKQPDNNYINLDSLAKEIESRRDDESNIKQYIKRIINKEDGVGIKKME